MERIRDEKKFAPFARETQEKHPPSNAQSRNTSVSKINEEYLTEVIEKIEA